MLGLINWNVSPIIFEVGSLQLRYYGVLFVFGLIISYFIMRKKVLISSKRETQLGTVVMLLNIAFFVLLFAATSREKPDISQSEQDNADVSNISFTTCTQNTLKSDELTHIVDAEFTNNGVEITYNNFINPVNS